MGRMADRNNDIVRAFFAFEKMSMLLEQRRKQEEAIFEKIFGD
jgi:hypothetical protein